MGQIDGFLSETARIIIQMSDYEPEVKSFGFQPQALFRADVCYFRPFVNRLSWWV